MRIDTRRRTRIGFTQRLRLHSEIPVQRRIPSKSELPASRSQARSYNAVRPIFTIAREVIDAYPQKACGQVKDRPHYSVGNCHARARVLACLRRRNIIGHQSPWASRSYRGFFSRGGVNHCDSSTGWRSSISNHSSDQREWFHWNGAGDLDRPSARSILNPARSVFHLASGFPTKLCNSAFRILVHRG